MFPIVFSGDDSYDLDSQTNGSPETWRWFFDYHTGQTTGYVQTTNPYVSHQYTSAGTYTVALIYFDNDGQSTMKTFTVVIGLPQQALVVHQRFVYDAGGRLLKTYQKNNEEDEVLVSQLEYNELGQVVKKKLHSTDGTNFLQTMDYAYNERGWLQQVNDPYDLAAGSDLFGFRLAYNQAEKNLGNTLKWDGTISGMVVADANPSGMGKVGYKYDYDDLGRLTEGNFATCWVSTWILSSKYNEKITEYDYNGNIKRLERNTSAGVPMDRLQYTYDNTRGNRLKAVEDAIGGTDAIGFTNGTTQTEEYLYDNNGNLIEDKNKGIQIAYNYLNLPTSILWTNAAPADRRGNSIELLYSATGEKLRMTVNQIGGMATVTDYVGGFEYNNSVLQHISMSEGRVNATTTPMDYEYFMKDHLGNVRMTIKNGATNAEKIAQQDFYYPFGLRQGIKMPGLGNNKLYNGKDLVDDFGLSWYHYGARWYDPQLGRWTTMDPLDEFHSPYSYGPNDPINGIDFDGMFWEELWNSICGKGWINNYDLEWAEFEKTITGYKLDPMTVYGTRIYESKISEWTPTFTERWSESNNIAAKFAYIIADGLWVTGKQIMDPSGENNYHIGGRYTTGNDIQSALVITLSLAMPAEGAGTPTSWLRLGKSYSKIGKFPTKFSIRWGSNVHHQEKILYEPFRNWNAALRETKLPFDSWRTADPGHFHLIK